MGRIVYVLCFFIGISLSAHNQQMDSVPNEPTTGEQAQYSQQLHNDTIWYRTWWNAEAFWGMIMACLTVAGFIILIWQVRETRKATTLTKKSIDAYIATERGRIKYHGIQIDNWGKNVQYVHIQFINAGKGDAYLTDCAFYAQKLDKKPQNEWAAHLSSPSGRTELRVKPEKIVVTGFNGGDIQGIFLQGCWDGKLDANELVDVKAGKLFIFIRGWIRYADAFGHEYDIHIALNYHPDHMTFIQHEHTALNIETNTPA
jgi:hypothetical protein